MSQPKGILLPNYNSLNFLEGCFEYYVAIAEHN